MLFSLTRRYAVERVFVESGQQWGTLKPLVMNEMLKKDQFFNIEEMPSITDKRSRSSAIRARMQAGAVKFDKEAEWYPDFEEECLRFTGTGSSHDDQVDALSMLGLALLKFIEAPTEEEQEEAIYQDELESSGMNLYGRSEFTGY
jgi:predicted phage terminase large subunit-like protein